MYRSNDGKYPSLNQIEKGLIEEAIIQIEVAISENQNNKEIV